MLGIAASSQAFQSDQQRDIEITYYNTPFTVLENGVASGGIRFDLMNPNGTNWGLPAYLQTAPANTNISTGFRATSNGSIGVQDGRVASVIDYWAGGGPAHLGSTVNGRVGLHYYGHLRSALGRGWFDANEIPAWYLAIAGSGWVRIDKHIGPTVTTIFNALVSESDFLFNGFAVSTAITDMQDDPDHTLHIYYAQSDNEPWGGLVVKAVSGAIPLLAGVPNRAAIQAPAREAPVLSAGLIDDGITSKLPGNVLQFVDNVDVQKRKAQSSTVGFNLPLMNMANTDGVGWEYKRDSKNDPGRLRFWSGTWTDGVPAPVFEMKHQRLIRVRIGFTGETLETVFVGLLDDFDEFASGHARVMCTGFEDRMIERHDKNYPDKISYMARGYKKLKGTSEPTYDTPAFDNWPMEYAVSELMLRMGIDSSKLYKPLMISRFDDTAIAATFGSETFRKFRARLFNSTLAKPNHLRLERAVHYGNNGIVFNEDKPADDEYVFKPENTLEGWKRVLDMTDRYGYECCFDEYGDASLQPRNNPHFVYDVNPLTDVTSGSLTTDIHPSAYQGTFHYTTSPVTVRKTVTGARIDVCLPRGPGFGPVTVNIYRAADLTDIIQTSVLTATLASEVFYYDFRSTVDGTNATIATVYTGEFDDYVVEMIGDTSVTRRFDCIFTYHTDPATPKLPIVLSTDANALSIDTRGSMEEMRNSVTVVGRKKATLTDSEKLELNPNNPESEFVVSRAVDVRSITDPTATNYIGYPRETLIYSKDITDQDFAEYLSRTFIYRHRIPAPSAPIRHTLLPCVQLRDPLYARESRYDSIPTGQVLYIVGYTHRITLQSATTDIDTTAFPEFPAYEPRQDIDIDQPEFGGYPVMNVNVSYRSLTNTPKSNLPMYTAGSSVVYIHGPSDIVTLPNKSTAGGQIAMSGDPWPPVPGTLFLVPNMGTVTASVVTGTPQQVAVGQQFNAMPLPGFNSVKTVTVTRYTYGSIYDSVGTPDAPTVVTSDPTFNKYGFFYQVLGTTLTIRRALVPGGEDSTTTLNYLPKVEYYAGAYGPDSGVVTNNPYHHLFDIDYRSNNRTLRLGWHQGDDRTAYQLPGNMATCTVKYRRLGPVGSDNFFQNPYSTSGSPFYDPYTSELGYLVNVKFDALVSGTYRVSIRNATTKQIVAWLTEPTADPEKAESHWVYLGAGVDKEFVWDGVDNVGQWNSEQSQPYAAAALGEFEQSVAPTIGKGFYVWNEEKTSSGLGKVALISGDTQDGSTHPVTSQLAAPVFGIGTFAAWYVQIEAESDSLVEKEDLIPLPRTLKTLDVPKTTLPKLYYKLSSEAVKTQAIIYTHLPRATGIDLQIADWVGGVDYSTASQTDINNEANWYSSDEAGNRSTADSDGRVNNDKPVRIRFSAQPRPGVLWSGKQNEVSLKLSRAVHLRAHIFDQFIVYDGNNFAGTEIPNRAIVNRRLVNDSHTIRYDDSGYRKAKDFKPVNAQGSEWIFKPKDFKKNFRGIDNEPIEFGDYLQLEELPKWDDNRQIAGARSRMQIAFMNYMFYLSAYCQDRSGRLTWGVNRKFLDRSKIITNDPSHWWNPDSPGTDATSSTFKVPLADDPMRLHRRTVVTRQWTDERVESGSYWREAEAARWGFATNDTSVGYQLLRHKWADHEPTSAYLNGTFWGSFTGLFSDQYSRYALERASAPTNGKLYGSSEIGLSYPANALTRQLGAHQGNGQTSLNNWTWELQPLWAPCITRDFHPYFLVPPMVDPAYPADEMQKRYLYGQVSQDTYDAGSNRGDDVAQGATWSSATHEMTVPYTSANGGKTHMYAGTSVKLGTNPTKNLSDLGTSITDYVRQDEMVHYEDLRGMYSRGPRPGEAPKKVTPVQPYYVNPMAYGGFVYNKAYRNNSYPRFSSKVTKWFDMKFRTEYFWESGAWFPVDNYGRENLEAMNVAIARTDSSNRLLNTVKYDTGAWTGWKDDVDANPGDSEFYIHAIRAAPTAEELLEGNTYTGATAIDSAFTNNALVVGVGPKVPECRNMIFHMVLVNERREVPAVEN